MRITNVGAVTRPSIVPANSQTPPAHRWEQFTGGKATNCSFLLITSYYNYTWGKLRQDYGIGTTPVLTSVLLNQWIQVLFRYGSLSQVTPHSFESDRLDWLWLGMRRMGGRRYSDRLCSDRRYSDKPQSGRPSTSLARLSICRNSRNWGYPGV